MDKEITRRRGAASKFTAGIAITVNTARVVADLFGPPPGISNLADQIIIPGSGLRVAETAYMAVPLEPPIIVISTSSSADAITSARFPSTIVDMTHVWPTGRLR
jgi:hypothetical protein